MPNKKLLVSTVAWLSAEKVTKMLIGLALGSQIARFLGPETFGSLSYLLTLLSFFTAIVPLGADPIFIREIASKSTPAPVILGTALRLRIASALTACILMSIWIGLSTPKNLLVPGLLTSAALLLGSAEIFETLLQATGAAASAAKARIIAMLLSAILKVLLIIHEAGIISFILAQLLEAGIAASLLFLAARKNQLTLDSPFDANLAKRILGESWPILVSGLAVVCYMRLDQVIVLNLLGPRELGIYNAASALSTVWYILPAAIITALAPTNAHLRENSSLLFERSIRNLLNLFLAGSLVLCLIVSILSEKAVAILFGPAYQESGHLLKYLIWSNVFVFSGLAQNLWIINNRKTKENLLKLVIGALTSVSLNLILIPKWGLIGCAIAAISTQLTVNLFLNALLLPDLFRIQITAPFQSGGRPS